MRFNLRTVVWIGFLLSTGLFLGGAEGQGCGGKSVFESMADDSTDEAKLEKAKIALDDGEFADAVEILADLCGTDLTAPVVIRKSSASTLPPLPVARGWTSSTSSKKRPTDGCAGKQLHALLFPLFQSGFGGC